MSARSEFTKATKLAAFQRSGGHCEKCGAKLYPAQFEYHHDLECTYGGAAGAENCLVLCKTCHRLITRQRTADIAKSNRVRDRHLGIKRPKRSIPGRRFNGEPIRHRS